MKTNLNTKANQSSGILRNLMLGLIMLIIAGSGAFMGLAATLFGGNLSNDSISKETNIQVEADTKVYLHPKWNFKLDWYMELEDVTSIIFTSTKPTTYSQVINVGSTTAAGDDYTSGPFDLSFTTDGTKFLLNSNVQAYINGTTVYIYAPTKIYAPSNHDNLFGSNGNMMGYYLGASFSGLKTIDFSNFDISTATTMSEWFDGCKSLISLDLSNWDTSNITGMYSMFYNCQSLKNIKLSSNFVTNNVTSLSYMFYNCSSLKFNTYSLKTYVEGWNTSKNTKLTETFYNCDGLSSLDLTGWNTSLVTSLERTFSACNNLATLNVSGWDTSSVTNMYYTFSSIPATTLDLASWTTSAVTDMNGTFNYCQKLEYLDISGFTVPSECTNFLGNTTGLLTLKTPKSMASSIELGHRYLVNTASAKGSRTYLGTTLSTNLTSKTFKRGYTLTANANGGTITTATNYTIASGSATATKIILFDETISTLPTATRSGYKLRKWNDNSSGTGTDYTASSKLTADVTMYAIWAGASSITIDPNGGVVTINGVEYESETTFTDVTGATLTIGTPVWPRTDRNYKFTSWTKSGSFYGTLSGDTYTFGSTSGVTSTLTARWAEGDAYLHVSWAYFIDYEAVNFSMHEIGYIIFTDEKPRDYIESFNVGSITDGTGDVSDNVIAYFSDDPVYILYIYSSNIIHAPVDCTTLFYSYFDVDLNETLLLESLSGIEFYNFDTSNTTNMSGMFLNVDLMTLDLRGFDTVNVTDMSWMFQNATIDELYLGFDTSSVTTMEGMFLDAYIENIDISTFETPKVTTMESMFENCRSLTSLNLGSRFDGYICSDFDRMFYNCSSLDILDISKLGIYAQGQSTTTDMFTGMTGLNVLYTPYWCDVETQLPATFYDINDETGTATWTELPDTYLLQIDSILLVKNTGAGVLKNGWLNDVIEYASLNSNKHSQLPLNSAADILTITTINRNTVDLQDWLAYFDEYYSVSVGANDFIGNVAYKTSSTNFIDVTAYVGWCYGDDYVEIVLYTHAGYFYAPYNSAYLFSDNSSYSYDGYLTRLTSIDLSSLEFSFDDGDDTNSSMVGLFKKASSLTKVEFRGGFYTSDYPVESGSMFSGCLELVTVDFWGTPYLKNPTAMFANCNNFTTYYTENDFWYIEGDASSMFYGCYNFIWDIYLTTGILTGASSMFGYCTNMTVTSHTFDSFNFSGCITFEYMFEECTAITNIDCTNWVSSSAENLFSMFNNCKNLTTINVTGWNTGNVVDMNEIFYGCSSLETITGISNLDTSSVTYMSDMFSGCSSLTALDLSGWETDKVQYMHYMFSSCTKLKDLTLWETNTTVLTDATCMFYNCSSLEELNLEYVNCDNSGVKVERMLDGTTSLRKIYLSQVTPATAIALPFIFIHDGSGSEVTQIDFGAYGEGDYLYRYGSLIDSSWYSTISTQTGIEINGASIYFIKDFTGTSEYTYVSNIGIEGYVPVEAWISYDESQVYLTSVDDIYVKDASSLFSTVSSSPTIILNNLNVSRTTTMENMFKDCCGLTTLIFPQVFDTSNVTNMSNMFNCCCHLQSLTLPSSIVTTNVTNMSSMFFSMCGLNELVLPNTFSTTNVTNMSNMFDCCEGLTDLNLSMFNMSKVTTYSDMFLDCNSLVRINIPKTNSKTNISLPTGNWYNTSSPSTVYTYMPTTSGTSYEIAKGYLVTYNANGGSGAPSNQLKVYGEDLTLSSTVPARDCYIFKGWGTSSTATTASYNVGNTYSTNADLPLYAVWESEDVYLHQNWKNQISSAVSPTKITSIEFTSTQPTTGTAYNVGASSATDTGTTFLDSVQAYVYGTTIKIYSPVTIYAPADSSQLFSSKESYNYLTSLQTISFNNFNTSTANNMYGLFMNCYALNSVTFGSMFETSNVTNMSYMFYQCNAISTLVLPSEFNPKNVTDMSYMFNYCEALTSLSFADTFDTGKVENMSYMFDYCESLTELIFSDKFVTTSVTNMTRMLSSCRSLTKLDISNFTIKSGTTINYIIGYNMDSLKEIVAPSVLELEISLPTYFCDTSLAISSRTAVKTISTTDDGKTFKLAFTLTADSNGGTLANDNSSTYTINSSKTKATKVLLYDETISSLPVATRTGYTFDWWNTSADGTGSIYKTSNKLTANTTIYAMWTINSYGLMVYAYSDSASNTSFANNKTGGTVKIGSGTAGASAIVVINYNATTNITATAATGYTFKGWWTTADFSGTAVSTTETMTTAAMTTSGLTYYAKFEVNSYKVEAIAGTGITSVTCNPTVGKVTQVGNTTYLVKFGGQVTVNATVSGGYTWSKWTDTYETTTKEYTFTMPATEVSLTATGAANSYKITLNNNSATTNGSLSKTSYNTSTSVQTVTVTLPARTGYTLIDITVTGDNASATVNADFTTLTIPAESYGNIILTAEWEANADTTYKVEHYQESLTGGYELYETEDLTGETDTTATAQSKEYTGFTFDEDNTNNVIIGNIAGDGSLVLKLYYTRNTYTVALTAGTGIESVSGANTYKFEQSVTVKATVMRGYTWSKWTQTSGGAQVSTTQNYTFTMGASNLSYTANAMLTEAYLHGNWQLALTNGGMTPTSLTSIVFTSDSSLIDGLTTYYNVGAVDASTTVITTDITTFIDTVKAYKKTDTEVIIYAPSTIYAPSNSTYLFSSSNSSSYLTALTTLTLTNLETSSVTRMHAMFAGCTGLTSIDLSGFYTGDVTNMGSMFSGCSGLTGTFGTSGTAIKISSNFNTEKVTSMGSMFSNCLGLTNLDLNNFNTINVTNMNQMFNKCSGLTSLDISSFVTSSVTDMSLMFSRCSGLTSLDVSNFNTSSVTSMSAMFTGCSKLTSLDVSGFNTSSVTKMNSMFYGCSGLTSLDISIFDMTNVTSYADMFTDCNALTTIQVPKTNAITDIDLPGDDWYNTTSPSTAFTNLPTTTGDSFEITRGYLVTYNANGGEGAPEQQLKVYGEDLTLSLVVPTLANYEFKGWGTSSNATTASYAAGETYSTDEDLTLYAVWEVVEHTISYYSTSTSTTYTTQLVAYGATYSLPTAPTKTGFIFAGWSTSADITTDWVSGTQTCEADNSWYAVWKKVWTFYHTSTIIESEEKTYTLTASENQSYTKWYSGVIEGYTFAGISTNNSAGVEIEKQPYQQNLTSSLAEPKFYSVWSHTIIADYNMNGGYGTVGVTSTGTAYKNYDLSITQPASITLEGKIFHRLGFTFDKYAKGSVNGEKYEASSVVELEEDTTFYAIWIANNYTITYKDGDTTLTGLTPTSYTPESTDILPSYSKEGYTLLGWKAYGSGWSSSTTYEAGSSITGKYGDVTLTAQWETNLYDFVVTINENVTTVATVTVSANGETKTANAKGETTLTFSIPYQTKFAPSVTFKAVSGKTYNLRWGTEASLSSSTPDAWIQLTTWVTMGTAGATATVTLTEIFTISYTVNNSARGSVTAGATNVLYNGTTGNITAIANAGYELGNWTTTANTLSSTTNNPTTLTNVKENATVKAVFEARTDTAYTVNHFVMGTDGKYPTSETETDNLTGTTGEVLTLVELKKSSLEVANGISYSYGQVGGSTVTTTSILADGSRVINLYYIRSSYAVTLTKGEGISAVTGAKTYYYGASVTINATVMSGYTWSKWTGTFENESQEYTFTMPANDVTLTANTVANSDTEYKVEHYQESLTGEYELYETENLTGETDTTATAQSKEYTGFTFNADNANNVITGNIAGDGSLVLKLYYTRNSYTVTLTAGTGIESVSGANTYKFGASVTINAIVMNGYTWSKWTGTFENESQEYTFTMPANDVELTANTVANADTEYKVEHYQESLTGEYELYETEDLTGETDTTATAQNKEYTGFTFDADNANNVILGNIAGDGSLVLKLYYTRNTYTVTLTAGTGIESVSCAGTYKYEEEVTISAVVKGGYTWLNWTGSETLTDIENTFNMRANNLEYTANTTANEYSITLNSNEATTNGELSATTYATSTSEQTVTITLPARTGYKLIDITVTGDNASATVNADFTTLTIPAESYGNIILTAEWEANDSTTYKVEHYQKSLTGEYELYETENLTGETDTIVTAQSKEYTGFTFDADNVNNVITGTIAGDGSLVLKLYYSRNSYTVTLTAGTGIESVSGAGTYKYEEEVTISAVIKGGYTWLNWIGSETLTDIENTFNMPANNLEYTANTTANEYSITLNSNESTTNGELSATTYATSTSEQTVTVTLPARTGYTLIDITVTGDNASATVNADFTTLTIPAESYGNIILTAEWEANGSTAYKVEHYQESLDGTYVKYETEDLTGETDTTATAQSKEYTGFTFDADNVNNVITGTIAGDGSLVLKLYYTRNTYTVTLTTGIGIESVSGNGSYKYEEEVTISAVIKGGYTWLNWTGSETLTDIENTFNMPANNLEYTANTTANEYSITINSNEATTNGELSATTYATSTSEQTVTITLPARTGYTLIDITVTGDNVSATVNADFTTLTIPAESYGNIILTAEWEANKNTPYIVEHYVMNTNGEYETVATKTENLVGVTDTELTLSELVDSSLLVANGISYSYGQVNGETVSKAIIVPTGDLLIKLYYERAQFTLTINTSTSSEGNGNNGGSASFNSSSIINSIIVYYDTEINLYITYNEGYEINNLTSENSAITIANYDKNSEEITLNAIVGNDTINIEFILHTLTITLLNEGTNGNISFDDGYSANVYYGNSIKLTATANEGYIFKNYVITSQDNKYESTDINLNTITISNIKENLSVTAIYREIFSIIVNFDESRGCVSYNDSNLENNQIITGIEIGSQLIFIISPLDEYRFVNNVTINGESKSLIDGENGEKILTFIVNEALIIDIDFGIEKHSITINKNIENISTERITLNNVEVTTFEVDHDSEIFIETTINETGYHLGNWKLNNVLVTEKDNLYTGNIINLIVTEDVVIDIEFIIEINVIQTNHGEILINYENISTYYANLNEEIDITTNIEYGYYLFNWVTEDFAVDSTNDLPETQIENYVVTKPISLEAVFVSKRVSISLSYVEEYGNILTDVSVENTFEIGDEITFTANPFEGYEFINWNVSYLNSEYNGSFNTEIISQTYTITADDVENKHMIIEVVLSLRTFTLDVETNGDGSIDIFINDIASSATSFGYFDTIKFVINPLDTMHKIDSVMVENAAGQYENIISSIVDSQLVLTPKADLTIIFNFSPIYWTDDGIRAEKFAGGNGTQEKPYLITNGNELALMSYLINNIKYDSKNNRYYKDAYYQLVNDIDLTGYFWEPIGLFVKNGLFDGVLDYQFHAITGATIKDTSLETVYEDVFLAIGEGKLINRFRNYAIIILGILLILILIALIILFIIWRKKKAKRRIVVLNKPVLKEINREQFTTPKMDRPEIKPFDFDDLNKNKW